MPYTILQRIKPTPLGTMIAVRQWCANFIRRKNLEDADFEVMQDGLFFRTLQYRNGKIIPLGRGGKRAGAGAIKKKFVVENPTPQQIEMLNSWNKKTH